MDSPLVTSPSSLPVVRSTSVHGGCNGHIPVNHRKILTEIEDMKIEKELSEMISRNNLI